MCECVCAMRNTRSGHNRVWLSNAWCVRRIRARARVCLQLDDAACCTAMNALKATPERNSVVHTTCGFCCCSAMLRTVYNRCYFAYVHISRLTIDYYYYLTPFRIYGRIWHNMCGACIYAFDTACQSIALADRAAALKFIASDTDVAMAVKNMHQPPPTTTTIALCLHAVILSN